MFCSLGACALVCLCASVCASVRACERGREGGREKSAVSVMYEPVQEQDSAPPAEGLQPPPPPPTPPGRGRATEEGEGQAHASAATKRLPKTKAVVKRSRDSNQ